MNNSRSLVALTIVALILAAGAYAYALYGEHALTGTNGAVVATTTAAIGRGVVINGVSITPLEVVEDSRCPVDVQCIQAGRLRVRAAINAMNRDSIFTLGEPQTVGSSSISLASVVPDHKNSKVTLTPSDYRFTFTVVPIQGAQTAGVNGTVLLGPTCPVERNPPDTGCADKGYSTTITIIKTGGSGVFATTKSGADGSYSIALPPGSYSITAGGNTTLPRCAIVTAVVAAGSYTSANISCDTGIR